jgi:chemotaxis signal transduction protein
MALGQQPFLMFAVAEWRLALPLRKLRRVVPLPPLEAPFGAPPFIEGFFDFQGAPAAALRLDRLFGLGEESLGIYTPLIVVDTGDVMVALHVERIDGICGIADADLQPIGRDETFNACVVARFGHGGETVYVLSKDELLLAKERATVVAHARRREQRIALTEPRLADAS